ncbi:X2-like carbohydrate binding domain-containing protein, partial [Paenibacillus odorifer]
TPSSAGFDKKTANQADVAVTMTLNGNTLSTIKNGTATLVAGTDYTVSGSTVTIKKAYLATQAVGTTTLTFSFSAGATQSLAVAVTDTTTPVSNSTITPS